MFSWFKKKPPPPPEDWRLVKTIEAKIHWLDQKRNIDEVETIYYYLYESNVNNRRIEIKENGKYSKMEGADKKQDVYLKIIYPWLNGKMYDDIPTYYQMFAHEKEKHIRSLYHRILDK